MENKCKSIFRQPAFLFLALLLTSLFLLPGLLVNPSYSASINLIIAVALKIIIPLILILLYCKNYTIIGAGNDGVKFSFFWTVIYASVFSIVVFGIKIFSIWDDGLAWTQQIVLPALLFSHIIFLHFLVIIFWIKFFDEKCYKIPLLRTFPILIISFSFAILFALDEHYLNILDKYIYLDPKYEMNYFSMLFSHLRGGALN